MKVYIGKYINYIGPYQIAQKLFWWIPEHDNQYNTTPGYEKYIQPLGEWLASTWVNDFCEWVSSKRNRTNIVKIDDYDIWGMDHTLSCIIVPMLKRLKEKKQGTPFVYNDDLPDHLKKYDNEFGTSRDGGWNEPGWNYLMDEMIFAMGCISDDSWEEKFFVGEFDRDGYDKYNIRIQNGLILFGKYFRDLWT